MSQPTPSWIDSDAHIFEPLEVWERVDKEFRNRIVLTPMTEDPRYRSMPIAHDVQLDGLPIPIWIAGPRQERFDRVIAGYTKKYTMGSGWDPVQYIKDMDLEGLAKVALYPTQFLWAPWIEQLGPKFSQALARAYNDWIFDFCGTDRKRLRPVACVSLHEVDGAIAEAKRCAERGFIGVFVRPNPLNGKSLGHADYKPFYAALEELQLTVGIHEGQLSYLPTLGADRTRAQWATHCMSHPFEQMAAMASLLEGDIFGSFPKLNFLFLEAGTALWTPYWLNRLDAARHLYRGSNPGTLLPSEYFARQGFVTCEVDDPFLPQTLGLISDEKLLMSTDYPHQESPYPHSMKKFIDQKISEESRARIGWKNALRAYPRF